MPRTYSEKIKQKVRDLRSMGWSLGEISLKIKIPKNTISGWVKDIRLTEKQRKRIKNKIIASGAIGRPLAVKLLREKMEEWKEGIREKVKHFGELFLQNPEIGKLICGLLYLCEGSKYPASRFLKFANTDPKIISAFLNLLRKYFNIREEKLHCQIGHRWDQNIEDLKIFWSKITKIPLYKFLKCSPDKRTKNKPTKYINYKGVCMIIYCDVNLQFELQSIGESIIKNGAGGT